jgi:hypothetical protein
LNGFSIMNFRSHAPRAAVALSLLCLLVAPPGCKDTDPCDPGEESIGTACYPVATGGSASAGSSNLPQAGEAAGDGGETDGGAGNAATGNPDATFGTPCQTNAECGGDAPVCATDPLFYCTQLDCQDGEANAGACPDGWTCVLLPPNPSACVNLATAP